ncbi:MAG: TSUP family transporter [Gammaproteobacteria bacterium]|jgi:uncharacterized membrane protein YfcA|nr:TSUP family transporter [Gammaproteobacteria bacterium]
MNEASIGTLIAIFAITAGLSYFKALSGLGAAGLLVPIYLWLGLPINEAKAYGLFANATSLSGATLDNFQARRIDLKLGLPIILASVLFAPVGAYISLFISREVMMALFALFLLYIGVNALWPRRRAHGLQRTEDVRPNLSQLVGIGVAGGVFSGLLGVGGGGVIAALMLWMGCNAKKVAVVTAFAVPFSSMSGFVSYSVGGYGSWPYILVIGVAAAIAGYAGNKTMHGVLSERLVKSLVGVVSLMFAAKLILDILR